MPQTQTPRPGNVKPCTWKGCLSKWGLGFGGLRNLGVEGVEVFFFPSYLGCGGFRNLGFFP